MRSYAPATRLMCAAILLTAISAVAASAQQAPPLKLTPSLKIGSADVANYALTQVGSVAVSDDGTMFISQPMEMVIRVFDAKGKYVRSIGRRGNGPGEFQTITRIDWSPRGLYVLDRKTPRLTLFNVNGSLLKTMPRLAHSWGLKSIPEAPTVVMANGVGIARPYFRTGGAPSDAVGTPVSAFSAKGVFLRDVVRLRTQDGSVPINESGFRTSVPKPDGTNTLYDFSPRENAIVTVERSIGPSSSTYTLAKTRTDKTIVYRTTYSIPTVAISAAALEREAKRMAGLAYETWSAGGMPITRAQVETIYKRGYFDVKYQSPVDQLVVGRDGTVWIRRGSFGAATAEWIVFDPAGKVVGRLSLPAATRLLNASRAMIWTEETDEDDVPYVVKYAVTHGAR